MMKICFSNVDPNMRYGKDGQKGEGRLGSAIRNDIMNIINAMTQIGTDNIKKRFFKKDREGKYTIPNRQRFPRYVPNPLDFRRLTDCGMPCRTNNTCQAISKTAFLLCHNGKHGIEYSFPLMRTGSFRRSAA